MGRLSERLARLTERAEEMDRVFVVEGLGRYHGGGAYGPSVLLGVVGGNERAQAEAVAAWYEEHPGVPVKEEHRAILRAAGRKVPVRAKVGSGSARTRKSTRRIARVSRPS